MMINSDERFAMKNAYGFGKTVPLGFEEAVQKVTAELAKEGMVGATSLAVTALPTALVTNDVATHTITPASGSKVLKAGTAVGVLAGSGKLRPRVVTANPAIGLLESDAIELDRSAALTGYGVIVGGVIYENLLPDATGGPPKTIAAGIKTELAAAGTGFAWEVYQDTRS